MAVVQFLFTRGDEDRFVEARISEEVLADYDHVAVEDGRLVVYYEVFTDEYEVTSDYVVHPVTEEHSLDVADVSDLVAQGFEFESWTY